MLILASIFSFLISFLTYRNWKARCLPFLSLTSLYSLIWGTIFAGHQTQAIPYISLGSRAILYACLPIIFMYIGEQLGIRKMRKATFLAPSQYNNLQMERTLNFILIAGLVLSLLFFLAVWRTWGSPLAFDTMARIKLDRVTSGITGAIGQSSLFSVLRWIMSLRCLFLAGMIIGTYFYFTIRQRLWTVTIPLFSCLILDLSWGSRITTFECLLLFLITAMLCRQARFSGSKKTRKRVAFVITTVFFVLFLAYVGMQKTTDSVAGEGRYDKIWNIQVPLSVYTLIDTQLAPLATFDVTLNENRTTFGFMSFGGAAYWLYLFRLLPHQEEWTTWELEYPDIRLGPGLGPNTYSWLRYLYSDFGVIGLCAVPAFVGWLSCALALRADRGHLSCFLSYVMCVFMIVKSPAIMIFRNDYIIFTCLLLWYIPVWARRGYHTAVPDFPPSAKLKKKYG